MPVKYVGRVDLKKLERQNKRMTAISLFTGCGGAALGLRQAGFEVRVMVEWMKDAVSTLRANWIPEGIEESTRYHIELLKKHPRINAAAIRTLQGHLDAKAWWKLRPCYQKRPPAIMNVDITKTSSKEILKAAGLTIGEASILEGGFPCQGFSVAGLRLIDDPRNQLYKECVRVIRDTLPRSFFLENVPGLISMSQGSVIAQIIEDLENCGYQVIWDILDAADFGVPQRRKRVIIIGQRVDAMIFREQGPALHIGCSPGGRAFPEWYIKRFKKNPVVAEIAKMATERSTDAAGRTYHPI